MRTASAALVAHLNNGTLSTFVADLYTVTLADYVGVDATRGMTSATVAGRSVTVCRWTTGDTTLAVGGLTFYPNGPTLSRKGVRQTVGVEITSLDVSIGGAGWAFPDGSTVPGAALRGVFDAARVKVERLFMPTWGDTSLGAIHWFEGKGSKAAVKSTAVDLTVKCGREDLNVPMPRRLYMPACPYAVFSPACGVSKATYAKDCTANAGASTTSIAIPLAQATDTAGYYVLGSVRFTSGALMGLTRTVSAFANANGGASHTITVEPPFPTAPETGSTFVLTPGCDHTLTTCNARYANLAGYGGFPYVPKPESIR